MGKLAWEAGKDLLVGVFYDGVKYVAGQKPIGAYSYRC